MEGKGDARENNFLSQYFANEPSFFDELVNSNAAEEQKENEKATPNTSEVKSQSGGMLTSDAFSGCFQAPDYSEDLNELDDAIKIPEEVRNFWEPASTESQELTTPGMQTASDLADPILEAVSKHLGEAELLQRKILNVDSVTQDDRGLRTLIAAGCFRAAINLTGRLLTVYGQGYGRAGQTTKHSPHSLQLWFTRLTLLAKIGEYKILQAEAEPFELLNRSDVFFEHYPDMYDGKKGSIASFSFRLLLAELPIYLGSPQLALDRLSELYVISNEIKNYFAQKDNKDALQFWSKRELRVLYSTVNCAIIMRKYNLIDDIIRDMILERQELSKEERRALFSAWGRIYLQIGDIFGAEQKFAEARRMREINSTPDLRDLVDKGLITVAKNDFPEAFAIFQKALHLESGNTMVLNNMGVCLLYAGKLKEAINLFERAIHLNPQKSLNESLLINLSTLYELESNNSKNKKLHLLRLINRYKADMNISLEICLKLQTPN